MVLGATTLEVGRATTFRFAVRNPAGSPQQFNLVVLPNDLSASVSPTVHAFAPGEQIEASIRLEVPATLHGTPAAEVRREATVVVRDPSGALIGGVTFVLAVRD